MNEVKPTSTNEEGYEIITSGETATIDQAALTGPRIGGYLVYHSVARTQTEILPSDEVSA